MKKTVTNSGIKSAKSRPLAQQVRPNDLAHFVGQKHLLGEDSLIVRGLRSQRLPSLLLWGPPGCGKTTLAQILANSLSAHFDQLSAVQAGTKEIRELVSSAKEREERSVLFIDEIHRFNRAQQDALLPHVEDGTFLLIGATTENPSFEVNTALLSRMEVLRLVPLEPQDIYLALRHALEKSGSLAKLSSTLLQHLADSSHGDARRALNALEIAIAAEEAGASQEDILKTLSSTHRPLSYDKKGEEHYNVISAFIKSLRGSDPQAAIYYLARMLEGGEDPLFIARRLVVFASEDVGNADPRGIMVAVAAKEAVEFVGLPEARINLAQVVTYLAMAPKSNASYQAIELALKEIKTSGALPVPLHLRNAVTSLMKKEQYGQDYQYAHSFPEGIVSQTHLPDQLREKRFYSPKDSGFEKNLKERLDYLESFTKNKN